MRIPIPKEHGAWAMLFAPMIVAIAISHAFPIRVLFIVIAIVAVFFAHGPLFTIARLNRNQPGSEENIRTSRMWLIAYLLIAGAAAIPLIVQGFTLLFPAGIFCAALLAYQTYLSAKRKEKNAFAEFLVVISLTASAPAVLYVERGVLDFNALLLWALCILFFASSIFYVKMRVSRHVKKPDADRLAWQCVLYHLFIAIFLFVLVHQQLISPIASLAFAPLVVRAFWSFFRQTPRLSLKKIGITEIIWTVVFVVILSYWF